MLGYAKVYKRHSHKDHDNVAVVAKIKTGILKEIYK